MTTIEIEYDETAGPFSEADILHYVAECLERGFWSKTNGPVFWRGERVGAYHIKGEDKK